MKLYLRNLSLISGIVYKIIN